MRKKEAYLAPFMPGNMWNMPGDWPNINVRPTARILGFHYANEPEEEEQDSWQPQSAFYQPPREENFWQGMNLNKGWGEEAAGRGNAWRKSDPLYNPLRPSDQHIFGVDEESLKRSRRMRPSYVLYDNVTNMIDMLEDADELGYYDDETEQYIYDLTKGRKNPRYEFLLPENAAEKQELWEKADSRWGKNWNPFYGATDGLKKEGLGYNHRNSYSLTGDERQRLEDRMIKEAAALDYKEPDSWYGNIIHELGNQLLNGNEIASDLLEKGNMYDLFLQESLKLERKPLAFYKKNKKIRDMIERDNISLAQAIERAKRDSVYTAMQDFMKEKDKNFAYDYFYKTMDKGREKDFYKIMKDVLVDIPMRRKLEEQVQNYFFE